MGYLSHRIITHAIVGTIDSNSFPQKCVAIVGTGLAPVRVVGGDIWQPFGMCLPPTREQGL
jgi:hypothetical protein